MISIHVWWLDETWVHYYDPENKARSRHSGGPGSPRPKKFKTQPPAGKVMATVFWDAQGVIMLDFLAKKSTITVVYYANLLDQLRTVIHEKRRGKLSKGILLHNRTHLQNCNGCCWAEWVRANTAQISSINKLGWFFIDSPSYHEEKNNLTILLYLPLILGQLNPLPYVS